MPIFDPVAEAEVSDEVQRTYEQVKERCGGVLPDLYKQLANSPTYLASITDHMGRVMGPGKIDETTKR